MSRAPDPTIAMVRYAVRWSLIGLPVVALLAGAWRGWPGALAAGLGSLVVTCFFALGVIGVNVLVTAVPAVAVGAGVGVYGTQILVLLLVYVGLRDFADIDRQAFAFGAVAGTMIWQLMHTRAFVRTRTPLYTLTAPKEEP